MEKKTHKLRQTSKHRSHARARAITSLAISSK